MKPILCALLAIAPLSAQLSLHGSYIPAAGCSTQSATVLCITASPYYASGSSVTTTTVGTTAPGTSVVVSSASSFSLNQGISIAAAGAAGATYIGRVTAIAGTTFTVSPATSTSVSAGAAVMHDETNAFQSAITALSTSSGTILVPDGFYRINGPLQDTSGANSILLLPNYPIGNSSNSPGIALSIQGYSPPVATPYEAASTGGAILQTSAAAGSLIGGYSATGTYGNFTFVNLTLKNLTFRAYDNPAVTMVNCWYVAECMAENLIFDVGHAGTPPMPTHSTGRGLVMPHPDNWALSIIRNVQAYGYYTGIEVSAEHAEIDNAAAFDNVNGFLITTAAHSLWAGYILCQDNTYCISTTQYGSYGAAPVLIDELDTENVDSDPGWSQSPITLINDPSNYLSGQIVYWVHGTIPSVSIGASKVVLNSLNTLSANAVPPPLGGVTGWVPANSNGSDNGAGVFATQAGQVLTLTPTASGQGGGYRTTAVGNFTGKTFAGRINSSLGGTGNEFYMLAGPAGSNYILLKISAGNLVFVKNGSTVASVAYSATSQLWWRIRESSGTWYGEVSADGASWSQPSGFSTTVSWTYSSGCVEWFGVYLNATPTGYAQIDQVSIQ